MDHVTLPIAFTAGVFSFFSPCIWPIVPAYLLCIAGLSYADFINQKSPERSQRQIIINALFFIAGFSLVFVALGALAGLLGHLLFAAKNLARILGGGVIIILGIYVLGFIPVKFLLTERRMNYKAKNGGVGAAFLSGVIFAAAWTPCVGPILGSILVLAGVIATLPVAVMLLTGYALGLAVPFLACAIFLRFFLKYFMVIGRFAMGIKMVSGMFLVIIGILLLLNKFGG